MKRKIIGSVTASFVCILLFTSCAKIDTTEIGNDLIPPIDNINTIEKVLDVITDNQLFTDTSRMIDDLDHGVGIIENDIEFGKTSLTSYTSFTPTAYRAYLFGRRDSVLLDSVVLSLAFSKLYGDSTSIQQFEVREIDPEDDFKDSLYYLNAPDLPVLETPIGTATVNFLTLNDPLTYKNGKDTIKTTSELRIRLDTSWARRFVNYDTTTDNAYNGDSIFKDKFRGLQIKASDASQDKRALAYFNLEDNEHTRITFYGRVPVNGKMDTVAKIFTYTSDPHANILRRTPANGYLANINNSVENDEKIYLQSSPGSFVTVKIPQLDTFKNSVIHRAELIIEKYSSQEDNLYAPPETMFITAMNPAGDSSFTIRNDFVPIQASPGYDLSLIGGQYKNDKYILNISRYVQSVITKDFPNYTLKVYAPFTTQPYYMVPNSNQVGQRIAVVVNPFVGAGRIVTYGGASTDPKRMRLRIIYSPIQ